jgi:hypothetical protein
MKSFVGENYRAAHLPKARVVDLDGLLDALAKHPIAIDQGSFIFNLRSLRNSTEFEMTHKCYVRTKAVMKLNAKRIITI